LPHSAISEQTTKYPETLAKQGISRHKGAKHNYDKNTFYLPRQDTGITPESLEK
jgi:hypothetical protein